MGNANMKETVQAVSITGPQLRTGAVVAEKPKCKACCACPETKRVRDQW